MPKITIIRSDNMVYVDNKAHKVDCSALNPSIRAIQWNGKRGHVEYEDDADGNPVLNTELTDISPYQDFIDAWQAVENAPPPKSTPAPTKEEMVEAEAKAKGFASAAEYAKYLFNEAAKG